MRFNILMEDGGVYQNAIILSSKGMARSKRDVHCALKHEGCITICCKYAVNKKLMAKDVYEIEEIQQHISVSIPDENNDDEEDETDVADENDK